VREGTRTRYRTFSMVTTTFLAPGPFDRPRFNPHSCYSWHLSLPKLHDRLVITADRTFMQNNSPPDAQDLHFSISSQPIVSHYHYTQLILSNYRDSNCQILPQHLHRQFQTPEASTILCLSDWSTNNKGNEASTYPGTYPMLEWTSGWFVSILSRGCARCKNLLTSLP